MNTNRRGFLKWLGIGAGAVVAAPLLAMTPKETRYGMYHHSVIKSDNWLGYKDGGTKIGEAWEGHVGVVESIEYRPIPGHKEFTRVVQYRRGQEQREEWIVVDKAPYIGKRKWIPFGPVITEKF